MLASLVDRIRNEAEVGVPRRFSIGILFVLLTMYGVLFRLLVLLNADVNWTAIICLFFSAVTIGQMVLFRGGRPRAASIVSGALVCPAMLVGLAIDEVSTRLSGWTPLENGLYTPGAFASAFLLLAIVGSGFGYLVGCATAGVFYVIGKVRPSISIANSEAMVDELASSRSAWWVAAIGQWINPIQPRTPLRGALAAFFLTVAFGFLISPFLTWLAPYHVMMVSVAAGACLAVWSGNLQLWLFWPIVLSTVGAVSATGAAHALQQLPFCQETFRREPDILLYMVRALGCLTGLTISAVAGWTQWAMYRHRENGNFGVKALAGFTAVLVGVGALVTHRLEAWHQSPTQRILKEIATDRGSISWNLDQTLGGITLTEQFGDDEFLQLRPLLVSPYGVDLRGPKFTDVSIKALDGLHVQGLTLRGTSITDEAFDEVSDFSASQVYLWSNDVGDRLVSDLVALPRMQQVLELLALDRTKISDEGLSRLTVCGSLNMLSLNRCEITDAGLANLAGIPKLERVSLAECPITNDGLKTLVEAVPRLSQLTLDGTGVSDAGLVHLAKAKGLREVRLLRTQVTRVGITSLQKALPSCAIRWSDPNED